MSERTCSIEGCDKRYYAYGWCNTHYQRWRKWGDPTKTKNATDCPDTCSIDDCNQPYYGRGWCKFHYQRWYKHGDPLKTTVIRGDDKKRIMSKLDVQEDGCWMWTGAQTAGYGYTRGDGRQDLVHRIMYRILVGPIPEELELDHTCHTNDPTCLGGDTCPHRACVNPDHLEPVTPRENVRRYRQRRSSGPLAG